MPSEGSARRIFSGSRRRADDGRPVYEDLKDRHHAAECAVYEARRLGGESAHRAALAELWAVLEALNAAGCAAPH